MTNPDYTALLFIIDRSGSMFSIKNDIEQGLASVLEENSKLPGKVTVDIAYFDNEFDYATQFALVSSAKVEVYPRGSTALFDAIVNAATRFGQALAQLPEDERPGKVIVTIATDGLENASREATVEDVKRVITEQRQKYDWEFVFLGSNQDAVLTAKSFGIPATSALTFTTGNVSSATTSLGHYHASYRSKGAAAFSDEDRNASV